MSLLGSIKKIWNRLGQPDVDKLSEEENLKVLEENGLLQNNIIGKTVIEDLRSSIGAKVKPKEAIKKAKAKTTEENKGKDCRTN